MTSTKIAQGTTIHCNRCDGIFDAPAGLTRQGFCGTKAARIEIFAKCPLCGQNDSHWVYAADVMPEFEGGFDARRKAERKWLREN